MEHKSSPRRLWLAGAAVFFSVLINGVFWGAALPPNGAPDENDHAATQRFAAANGRLPRYGEAGFEIYLMDSITKERIRPITDPKTGETGFRVREGHPLELRQPYLFSPQLAHLAGGFFCRLTGGFSLYRARLFSSLCIGLAALCVFLAASTLWPGKIMAAFAAGAAFGFWPQASFIGAYVNDDAFALAAVSLLLFACVRMEKNRGGASRVFLLGLAIGLTGLSKYYVYPVFPLLGCWGAWLYRKKGVRFAKSAAAAALIGMLITGGWFLRNALIYDGDPFGVKTVDEKLRQFVSDIPPPLVKRTRMLSAGSLYRQRAPFSTLFKRGWLRDSMESFFGRFGWMSNRMHPLWYNLAFFFVLISILWSVLMRAPPADGDDDLVVSPWLLALPYFALLVMLSLYNSYFVDFQPQGRYLLPCLPALCIQIMSPMASEKGRGRGAIPFLMLLFILAANVSAFRNYLI